jgi:hypothetical protein
MDCSLLFNNLKGRAMTRVHSWMELLPAVHAGKISPQLAGTAACSIKTSGWNFPECASGFARSGNCVEQQMGLFHCMAE